MEANILLSSFILLPHVASEIFFYCLDDGKCPICKYSRIHLKRNRPTHLLPPEYGANRLGGGVLYEISEATAFNPVHAFLLMFWSYSGLLGDERCGEFLYMGSLEVKNSADYGTKALG
ncbi:hypothetical protein NPIL_234441 [Nephila pilipes]|uniref:Uncharacterized protein n=1 Tax=Nephila pilipes TaxID=299642 RepID=A0A8X6MNT9_NEPPI|nr:hypothetical protein NPIL_234441 [Nephila pilipes]